MMVISAPFPMSRAFLLGAFVLLCCASVVVSSEDVRALEESDNTTAVAVDVANGYRIMDKEMKGLLNKLIRTLMPLVMKEVYRVDLSVECLNGLLKTVSGIKKLKTWALSMLDASGKIPDGFFAGTFVSLGDYNECLNIDVVEDKMKIRGQYCTIITTPPLPEKTRFMSVHIGPPTLVNLSESGTVLDKLSGFIHNAIVVSIRTGVCIPSMCTADDLQKLVQIIPQQTGLDLKFTVKRCEVKTETVLTDVQKAVLITFGIVSFLLVLGTVIDWWYKDCSSKRKGIIVESLRCFSITSTIEKLCTYEAPDDATRFVYGIVALSFLWVNASNTLHYANYDTAANAFIIIRILKMYFFEVVTNKTVAIQNLFFVSGFISSYRANKSNEDICIRKYILFRFLRYTPAYAMAIAMVMLTPIFGSGPTWFDHVNPMYDKCRESWWANVLYVNNYIDPETTCLDNTSFFAIDAQLHVSSLLLLILLKRKPKLGLILCFGLIGGSLLTVALTNVYYDLPPAELIAYLHPADRAYYSSHTFNRIYSHLCIYCSGIVVGYLVVKKPYIIITKNTCLLIWLFLFSGVFTVLLSIHHWRLGEYASDPLGAALYASFGKAVMALSISWTAYICCTGKGGMVNSVLGWRLLPGLGRLMFMAFIFNPVVMTLIHGFEKTQTSAGHFESLYVAANHVVPTLLVAFICHVAFEGPVIALNQMMWRRCKSTGLHEQTSGERPKRRNITEIKRIVL